jgi:predicted alpha/beta-fold hydrolase
VSFQPEPFRAAWWLPGAHAQTIAGRMLRPLDLLPLQRERIDTPDGDFVDLDFAPEPDSAARNRPLALVLHGLEGSARRGYAYLTYRELARVGIRGVGLNFRSCSGEPNRLPRFYHSGDTDDIRHVVAQLRQRFPDRPIGAIGFSLGGNALLKYLGEDGDFAGVRAAVGVSVPYDLDAGERHLQQDPVSRVYVRHFLKSLQAKAVGKEAALRDRCDYDAIHRARSFRDFDDAATAPLHGFTSAADYYARASSRAFLARIRIPTLLVHALDDPFLPPAALPHSALAENPRLRAAFTEHGGHVGFIGGSPRRPDFWAERQAAGFLADELTAI